MNKGDRVVWIDPDDSTSAVYMIEGISGDIYSCKNESSELECPGYELKPLHSVLCCENCGNIDVQVTAWIYSNTNNYAGDNGEDEGWCGNCESTCELTSVETYLNNKEDEN